MAPKSHETLPKPKSGAPLKFKPPRPASVGKKTPDTLVASRQTPASSKSFPAQAQSVSEDDDDDDDDPARPQEDEHDSSQSPLSIPPALLTRLFHHHFKDEKVRMGVEARSVAGKYIEVFVREAIARAAFERQESVKLKEREGTRTMVGEGDFLEVEDLEKLAPQLLLDF